MRTKHLCVMIHIRNKDEIGTVKHVQALQYRSKAVLFCGSFVSLLFRVCLCHAVLSVPCSLVVTYCESTALLALFCVMFFLCFVTFQYGVLGQMWYLIVSIPDLWFLLTLFA